MNPHDDERAANMGRIWDDLVNGTIPADAEHDLLNQILDLRAWAAVPPPSTTLRASIWQQLNRAQSGIIPSVTPFTTSPNGHARDAIPPPLHLASASRRWGIDWPALYRALAVGAMAGFAAGFIAGIWVRIAMRLAAVLTIDRNRGLLTESQAVVGEFTLGGTIFLGLFAAAMGILGGVLYIAVRCWLPRRPAPRAITFGLLLFAVFGFIVMEKDNPDYQLFGPTWVNVGTFSLTYLVFGVLASLFADALDARLPRLATGQVQGRTYRLQRAVMTPFALFGFMAVAFSMIAGFSDPVASIVAALFLISGLGWIVPRLRVPTVIAAPRLQRAIGLAAFVPGLFGVWLTINGIVGILSG